VHTMDKWNISSVHLTSGNSSVAFAFPALGFVCHCMCVILCKSIFRFVPAKHEQVFVFRGYTYKD
jgi:hypothetical protein